MEQPSTVMLSADYGDVERRLAARAALGQRSRGMGLLGMLAALGGMPIEQMMDKLVGGAVAQDQRIQAETRTIKRLTRHLTGTRGGHGACGECGKTISANKEYCFAHIEPSSRTPKALSPTDVQPGWNSAEWEALHERIRKTMEDNGVKPVRVPGTGPGVVMPEDFDQPMEPLGDAADPDVEPEPSEFAFRQALEDYPKCAPGEYSCGAQYCDDPVCTTHGGLGGERE